ncbi:MAG: AbrB/MazE/SpoVT family DNA-binding domain-containing protein, partial [Pseudomonadales bacterium]|nr:AbrB/MazE/SpoVT family DNA-binding domain-containing protein [Pseudomonadales bacterium]
MQTAKVFMTGRSQAVRLPKEFRFEDTEVEIFRRGEEVILRKKSQTALDLYELLAAIPSDVLL